MYYGGVSRGGSVPYRMSIGLAISHDAGLTFQRLFDGPVVDRTPSEPYMTMAPNVLRTLDGWRMWYGSGVGWFESETGFEPIYTIKTATSTDGVHWSQSNHTCIVQRTPTEATTRPAVRQTANGYEMWFCFRDSVNFRDGEGSYRIGYAISEDGLAWTRLPAEPELAPTGVGWNASTMSYPALVDTDDRIVLFTNGDGFGKAGVGCFSRQKRR